MTTTIAIAELKIPKIFPFTQIRSLPLIRKYRSILTDVKSLDVDEAIAAIAAKITDLELKLEELKLEEEPNESRIMATESAIQSCMTTVAAIESATPLISELAAKKINYGQIPSEGIAVLVTNRSGRWDMRTDKWSGDVIHLDIRTPMIVFSVEIKISEFL